MKARGILLAGVAALLPAVVGAAYAAAPAEAPAQRFAPPTAPLVLTRTFAKSLADGKQVVVTRRYAIRFIREADGYRLEGEQISVDVDAPPLLASLAELERKRVDNGMFPARLDANGMIRESTDRPIDPATRAEAIARARAIVGQAPIPAQARRDRTAAVGQAGASPVNYVWPAFLFNPGTAERIERRSVALPGGGEGEVEVRIRVNGLMACGLPTAVERTIVTRLAGTSRTSREVWTLAAADGHPL